MIRHPAAIFGSADLAGDRVVVAEWPAGDDFSLPNPRVWFGDVPVDAPEWLLFVRAAFAFGFYWAIAKGQRTGTAYIVQWNESGAAWLDTGRETFGNQCVACYASQGAGDSHMQFVYADSGNTYRKVFVDALLLEIVSDESNPMPASSQGFLDLGPTLPVFVAPTPFRTLNGYLLGYPCTRPNATIGIAADARLANQLAVLMGDQTGTLVQSDDIREPHLSADGQTYVFWSKGSVTVGPVPAVCPPLILAPPAPMPDVSLVTPARSDFRLGAQMFNNAHGTEPNPHVPFGSFTVPIRLSTLPAGDIINAGQDNGHPISFYAGEDGSQTFAQAVALQRPKADAAGVGLSLYVDRVPFTPEDLAFYRPGDVLMPQVNAIAALEPAKALIAAGYPVCLSLGLQRQAPDVCASLIIEASKVVTCFGACIFAKDRSDVPWAAVEPYLNRWLSGVESPASWPRPEPDPMPAFPIAANLIVYTSNVLALYVEGGTVKVDPSYGVQPGYGQAYQRVTIDKSPSQPSKLRVFHPATNGYLGIDRVKAKDVNHLADALFVEPSSSPNADSTWLWFEPAGPYLIATGDSTDLGPDGTPARHGAVFALLVVDDAGKPIQVGGGKALAPLSVQGVNVVDGQ